MVKDHCNHFMGYTFQLAANDLFKHCPINKTAYTTTFVTSVVEQWLEWELVQWSTMWDQSDNPLHHEQMLFSGSLMGIDLRLTVPRNQLDIVPLGHMWLKLNRKKRKKEEEKKK